ncbi:MBL fold metallo-hydrolase [Aneurinibacillus sp. Ricciae_BoGa-3]|uniref:MBL fold metallo-hydrolase n=1 Tax=Aneurinibacillus sp. Ricciae_BoGa-3 TaxID=3022697 RepID=UPI00234045E9|nr:MBL fold metallo-hydrolase [Aneurinibacillus sp. Ricciae_BoGa-3]WCK52728.1 MBL fold metallo-hydrolase [Aneurinibacillus sp. Ricciae_BoGa-3]
MIQFKNEHLTIFESSLFQTTSTVVRANSFILIVDPCWLPHEVHDIRSYVETIRGDRKLFLLFTHADFDHIIGYRAFPEAKTIGSIGIVDHPEKARKLRLVHEFDWDYYIQRDYPIEFPEIDIVIKEDKETITIGDTDITFYQAPGHTHDGLFTVIDSASVFIAGDYLSDFEFPFIYHSAASYVKTLETARSILREHTISVLVPGHGKTTASIDEMERRITMGLHYIKTVRQAVTEGKQGSLDQLIRDFAFPSQFVKQCHADNIAIIQKEMGL